MINLKELQRREKIKCSLLDYFKSDQGIAHRNKLSALQLKRMALYGQFLKENNLTKTNNYEKESST